MIDAREVEGRTGWRVVAEDVVVSTNDEAARLRDASPDARVVVVADRQTAGRGRGGSAFSSPAGGLYASALVAVPADALPGPVVGAAGVAMAEAIEGVAGSTVTLKWPNDLWIEGKKAGGILVEAGPATGSALASVVIGVGVNVRRVPAGLAAGVAAEATALDAHAPSPVRMEDLLSAFLVALSARLEDLASAEGRRSLDVRFRQRAALVGERVRYRVGEAEETGVLRDVSLGRGILVEEPARPPRWRPPAHVRDLKRAPR